MSDTKRSRQGSRGSAAAAILLGLLTLFGLLLRSLRLNWQPLWWDEGYSAYFATEPLQQMFGLTALDIHPPLYYAMLHGWIALWGGPSPVILRSFSVAAGIIAIPLFGWMANQLFSAASPHSRTGQNHPGQNHAGQEHPGQEHPGQSIFKIARRWLSPRQLPVWIGVLLFAMNPLHIYYSQEVRMYGLALLFTLWSTGSFWRLLNQKTDVIQGERQDEKQEQVSASAGSWLRTSGPYIVATTLALYTLYYSALIPIAHLLYTLWHIFIRRVGPISASTRLAFRRLLVAQVAVGLLYLPWVLYAAPRLLAYVTEKIGADNDTPLTLPAYLGRHLLAFVFGHLPLPMEELEQTSVVVGWAVLLVSIIALLWWRFGPNLHSPPAQEMGSTKLPFNESTDPGSPIPALWAFLLVPIAIAFVLNLRLPFFPQGGERLLLLILPYFLLLIASSVAALRRPRLRYGALTLLLAISAAAVLLFYATPRHQQREYRGLVQHVMQNGRPEDRVLAIFPWQVGYWRAYTADLPRIAEAATPSVPGQSGAAALGPIPTLLGSNTLEWGDAIREQIDLELQKPGTLWYPAPLGLGSDLPRDIESYLRTYSGQAAADGHSASPSPPNANTLLNVDARWSNPTTFLTAWQRADAPEMAPVSIQFGPIALAAAGIGATTAQSANQVLPVGLTWLGTSSSASDANQYIVTLALEDDSGRSWASRNYSWPPEAIALASEGNFTVIDQSALRIPVGLPPGPYTIKVGLSAAAQIASADLSASQPALQPIPPTVESGSPPHYGNSVGIGRIAVTDPTEELSTVRLPTEHFLAEPITIDGVRFIGSSGAVDRGPFLAGTEIPLRLQLLNSTLHEAERHLYISLLDGDGAGVAGWAAWPLPNYPITDWREGALIQLPADIQLPASVASGEYRLIGGLVDPDGGGKSEPAEFGVVEIVQRQANFEQPAPLPPLAAGIARFGSHVDLLGYRVSLHADADVDAPQRASIQLEWHVQQSLLPSHHIFLHLMDEQAGNEQASNELGSKTPLAQHDDIPSALMSGEGGGAVVVAPTGSWQPGEYLTTQHSFLLPEGVDFDSERNAFAKDGRILQLRAGLYVPQSGIRLPVSIEGQPSGDSILLE